MNSEVLSPKRLHMILRIPNKPVKGVLRLEIEKHQVSNSEFENASDSGSITNELDHADRLTDSTISEWHGIHSNMPKEQPLNGSVALDMLMINTSEETGANADLTVNRKRGRPFKVKIRVGVTNETANAIPGAVNGYNTLNRGAETELSLLQDAFKTVKRKKRHHSIISLETETAPQGSQESLVQRTDGENMK